MKKKLLSGVLALSMMASLGLTACGGGGDTSGAVMINIMNTGGGVGRVWLDDAIERYQKDNPHVMFNIEHNIDTGVGTMANSGYAIYFVEQGGVAQLSASGKLLDISDVLTTKNEQRDGEKISILDKVRPEARAMLQGFDGKYYALPHFTLYSGLSYDAELFREKGFYFADYNLTADSVNVIEYNTPYGKGKFVGAGKTDVQKSVGNDGVHGTYDDGLPTTLEELCILCAYMLKCETDPILLNGTVNHYLNGSVVKSLWAALAGYEQMRACYDYSGEIDYVVGYEDATWFGNATSTKLPKTEKRTLTEATGYMSHATAGKYYATAFTALMKDKGWISADYKSNTVTPGTAQAQFICNGYNDSGRTYGMLVEATHWYNEAIANKSFKTYELLSEKENTAMTRDIRMMPWPTAVEGRVTGPENARKETRIQSASSYAFVNKNIEKNTTLVSEVKKFLSFLYTDAELSKFDGTTGVTRGYLNYKVESEDLAKLSIYQSSVQEIVSNSNVVYNVASNDTFVRSSGTLEMPTLCKISNPMGFMTYLDALNAGKSVKDIFEATQWSQNEWETTYYVAD